MAITDTAVNGQGASSESDLVDVCRRLVTQLVADEAGPGAGAFTVDLGPRDLPEAIAAANGDVHSAARAIGHVVLSSYRQACQEPGLVTPSAHTDVFQLPPPLVAPRPQPVSPEIVDFMPLPVDIDDLVPERVEVADLAAATVTGALDLHSSPPGLIEDGARGEPSVAALVRRPERRAPAHKLVRPTNPVVRDPAPLAPVAKPVANLERRRQLMGTLFAWVQNVGIILILFAGWQIWGTSITEHHAQSSLKAEFAEHLSQRVVPPPTSAASSSDSSSSTAATDGQSLVPATERMVNPPEGTVLARLDIPAIGVNEFVVSGTAASDLSMGPGHYIGTAMPGQAGNVAIAGHRTTYGAPFYRLGALVPGDPITLKTLGGQTLTYVVSRAPVSVLPGNTSILGYFGDNRLTLTTCTPPFSATHRLVVVAALEIPGVPTSHDTLSTATVPTRLYGVVGSATSSWNWARLPVVLLALGVLVALGFGHRPLGRSFGPWTKWLILAPIWVAGLYLFFQGLSGLLPPSV
jgi:sortase A